jgi:nitrogen fixation NifU-like protein
VDEIYQEFIIELYKNPRNRGIIENPDFQAQLYNKSCGDAVTLFIKTENGTVTDAKFTGQGCAISTASSSLLSGFLKEKKVEELEKITKDDVLGLIKIDLSKNPSRMKCALLPFDALKKALRR